MSNKQGFCLIIWLLFSMLVNAEENSLDAVVGQSDIVAQVIITSSEVVKAREGGDFMASCGILYKGRKVELLSGDDDVGEYFSFYGNKPLKAGRNYLIFLASSDADQADQINDGRCESAFISKPRLIENFEMKREGEASSLNKNDQFVLVYDDLALELPEEIRTWKREHELCDNGLPGEEQCQAYKVETLIDWNEIRAYLKEIK